MPSTQRLPSGYLRHKRSSPFRRVPVQWAGDRLLNRELLALVGLLSFGMADEREAWPSRAALGRRTGQSRPVITRAFAGLRRKGVIEVLPQSGSNRYRLAQDGLWLRLPDWIWQNTSATGIRVWLALVLHDRRRQGVAAPTIRGLRQVTGLSKTRVNVGLQELREIGAVASNGELRLTRYALHYEDPCQGLHYDTPYGGLFHGCEPCRAASKALLPVAR